MMSQPKLKQHKPCNLTWIRPVATATNGETAARKSRRIVERDCRDR